MTASRKCVLVVGSPRGAASISRVLGAYLLELLAAGGVAVETVVLPFAAVTAEGFAPAMTAVRHADLVVLSFPLYVDHLPAPVIAFLEQYQAALAQSVGHKPAIAALIQCGFPETCHTRPAVEIVRQFAMETGLAWHGALAMGMGGAIAGQSLKKGWLLRRQAAALAMAVEELRQGRPIPAQASELFGRPLMPRWLYTLVANWGMKRGVRQARNGVRADAQPYLAGGGKS